MSDGAQSLEGFREGISEVRAILKLGAALDHAQIVQRNAVLRASVVLLVSHFESFLKTVAEEFIDAVDGAGVTASRLPARLRELYSIPVLDDITKTRDDKQRRSLLKKLGQVSALWNDGAIVGPGVLKSQTLVRVVTSGKSEVINEFFGLMGSSTKVCDGDLDLVDAATGDREVLNVEFSLRDAIQCRNDIAHYGLDRKPTEIDVVRYVNFLETFAERLAIKAQALAGTIISNPEK